MKHLLVSLLMGLILSSCAVKGVVKFQQRTDFVFSSDSLKEYITTTSNPKVVLRVPSNTGGIVEDEVMNNENLWNAIERELIKAGFDVRDRSLFNLVLDRSDREITYDEIARVTGTDLIIDMVEFNNQVSYSTNRYFSKGKERLMEGTVTEYGASVEFRVIMIETNSISGLYTFHYTPCTEGCPFRGG